MFKKLALIGALGIGLMALWSTSANAYPGGLNRTSWWPGSLRCETTWVGISNTDFNQSDILITARLRNVVVYYRNPGDQMGGAGVPFVFDAVATGSETVFPTPLRGRGKYLSSITFSDGDLLNAFPLGVLDAYAPNPQWTAYAIDVITFDYTIEGYTDVRDDICETSGLGLPSCLVVGESPDQIFEEEVVHAEGNCSLATSGTRYDCTETDHWEYSNSDRTYPH